VEEEEGARRGRKELPDWFVTVAEDVVQYCQPEEGIWVDLGCGSGGLGLALAQRSKSMILLVDPNAQALSSALQKAEESGLASWVSAVVACAESIPLPDGSVNLVVSRGSIFFWREPPLGLREVCRILGPGGRAMIGGGFGTRYPNWALEEFFRGIHQGLKEAGDQPRRDWDEPRRPEWLTAQAHAAGLEEFLLRGLWLLFEKGKT